MHLLPELWQYRRRSGSAVGNQGNACTFQGFGNIVNRSQLRHAHAGHDTGRTNRARADTDFNGIRTCGHQIQSGFGSSDVAADDLDVRIGFFYPAHAIDNALAMTVGGIDHNYVHAGFYQCFDALFGIAAGTHRGTDAQAPRHLCWH